MSPYNPLFVVVILLICFVTAHLLGTKLIQFNHSNRFESIDGLRGLLAVFVFIHHSNIWYTYLKTGKWVAPESNLFNQIGQTSVALFFMISSYLFVHKLIQLKEQKINWTQFYKKRIYRLLPVHLFASLIIIVLVFISQNLELNVSFGKLVKSIFQLLTFGFFGLKSINDQSISIFNAGVLWSLPYEWLLYFLLPFFAIFTSKNRRNYWVFGICLVLVLISQNNHHYRLPHLASFLGGIIPLVIKKYYPKKIELNTPLGSVLLLLLLVGVLQFHTSDNYWCKLFISLAFSIVALGNNFFGFLKLNFLKTLGAISYSTYLLHGLVLYTVFNFVIDISEVAQYSELWYSILIFAVTPIVIVFSLLSFRFIESPFISLGRK